MRKKKAILLLYIFFILWVTLFSREVGMERITRGLLWEVRMGYWWDIALNILLFIPLGFLLGDKGRKTVLFGFLLSASIELFQYVAVLGYCEADDVLNNTIGTAVGFGIHHLFPISIKKWEKQWVVPNEHSSGNDVLKGKRKCAEQKKNSWSALTLKSLMGR